MFQPRNNPNYEILSNDAKQMITAWTKNEWYETSSTGDTQLLAPA